MAHVAGLPVIVVEPIDIGAIVGPVTVSGTVSVDNFPSIQMVIGTVAVSNFPATQAVTQSGSWNVALLAGSNTIGAVTQSGTWTVTQGAPNTSANAWPVEVTDGTDTMNINADGSINVANVTSVISTTAVLTQIPASVTSVMVLAANPLRKGFILFNQSTSNCYIAFHATASSAAFTIFLNGNMTYQNEAIIYTGDISTIWTSATGQLVVTELS